MLFEDEVYKIEDVKNKLIDNTNIHKMKLCVIGLIFEPDGRLLLHKRGAKARDEIGKLEAIGGSVNKSDIDFRSAMQRELTEETGSSAKYEIGDFIGAQLSSKEDLHTHEVIDWVIMAYVVKHISGKLINMEPERCDGFTLRYPNEYKKSELSDSCYNFIEYLINKGELK